MHSAFRTISLSLAGLLVTTLAVSYLRAAPKFSEWSAPTNVAELNSAFDEGGPAISKNGLSLYFQSSRPGGAGVTDIYVSERESVDDPWGAPGTWVPTSTPASTTSCRTFHATNTTCSSRAIGREVPGTSTSGYPGGSTRTTTWDGSRP